MFALTVVFGKNHSVVWTMAFRTAESAESAYALVLANKIENTTVTDDFGQRATFAPTQIIAVMLEDTSLSKLAHVERAIHNAHIQSDVQRMAEADPKLRIARNMQGPSMLSPMGNGRM